MNFFCFWLVEWHNEWLVLVIFILVKPVLVHKISVFDKLLWDEYDVFFVECLMKLLWNLLYVVLFTLCAYFSLWIVIPLFEVTVVWRTVINCFNVEIVSFCWTCFLVPFKSFFCSQLKFAVVYVCDLGFQNWPLLSELEV